MSEQDVQIGANLAQLRGDRSQQWLADSMRDLGWKWSQATVWAVEKGDRPLRLAEAEDVARILGLVGTHDLTRTPTIAQIQHYMRACWKAHEEIKRQSFAYLESASMLRQCLEKAQEDDETIPGPLATGGGWFETGPEIAAAEARYEWGHQEAVDHDRDSVAGQREIAESLREALARLEERTKDG